MSTFMSLNILTKSGVVRRSPSAFSLIAATAIAMCQWLVNVRWPGRSGKRSPCVYSQHLRRAASAGVARLSR